MPFMKRLSEVYNRVDKKIRKLSRISYAALIGITSMTASLIASTALGKTDIIFSTTIGITLATLNYISNPNQQ